MGSKLNRYLRVAALLCLLLAAPIRADWEWHPVRLGAGGWVTGIDIQGSGASEVRVNHTDSGFAYIWNTTVVQEWGATGASMVTYLTPLVGVSMGVMLRGDSLTWNAPLGGLIVIAGIALSQSTPKRVHSPG